MGRRHRGTGQPQTTFETNMHTSHLQIATVCSQPGTRWVVGGDQKVADLNRRVKRQQFEGFNSI